MPRFSQQTLYVDAASLLESAALLWGRWEILWQLQTNLKWKFWMSWVWRWNSDWNSSSSGFIFRLMWIEFALALCLQCSCVNYTQFVFSCCPTLLIVIRNSFQMYVLFLKIKLKLTLNSIPMEQTFPGISRYCSFLWLKYSWLLSLLCCLCTVLCSSLSYHFHVFSPNVVTPEILPS